MESPAWFARMRQVPPVTIVTMLFESTFAVVQTGVVAEEKVTSSSLLAVAEMLKELVAPRFLLASGPKVIVCGIRTL